MGFKNQPSIVFLHGGWQTSATFSPLIAILQSLLKPYKCVPVTLPKMDEKSPWTTWQPEVDAVRNAIEAEIKEGREVLLVVHSIRTLVASEALKGFTPGPIQLLVIAGHLFEIGQSFITFVGGTLPPVFEVKGDMVMWRDPVPAFYSDLPEEEQQKWAAQVTWMPLLILSSGLTYQAWKHFPTAYIMCEEDRACPPDLQPSLLARAQEEGAQIKVEKFKTGHFPFLSQPEKVADVIRRLAGEEDL